MAEIEIRPLTGIDFSEVHASWIRAFSDYSVPISLSEEDLSWMFRQNGVALDASAGAFDDGKLVGFFINGLRDIGGSRIAYDSGTAIFPEYRGHGLFKRLAFCARELLAARGAEEHRLEVIATNERAIRNYEDDGFRKERKFFCLQADAARGDVEPPPAGTEILEGWLLPSTIDGLPRMEYEPSWQNNIAAALAIRDRIHTVVAESIEGVEAYGFIDVARARILQLGARRDAWDRPIASQVLRRLRLAVAGREVQMINVDESAKQTIILLCKNTFSVFVDQFEMRKRLLPGASATTHTLQ